MVIIIDWSYVDFTAKQAVAFVVINTRETQRVQAHTFDVPRTISHHSGQINRFRDNDTDRLFNNEERRVTVGEETVDSVSTSDLPGFAALKLDSSAPGHYVDVLVAPPTEAYQDGLVRG